MDNNKLLTLLGFASKARKLSFGMDPSIYSVQHKKAYVALAARDVSDKSFKEIKFFCDKFEIPLYTLEIEMEQLSHAIGKKAGIISINDDGFAKAVSSIFEGGNSNNG